jgi:hypothetical protein
MIMIEIKWYKTKLKLVFSKFHPRLLYLGSTVLEHLSHHPEVDGSSPVLPLVLEGRKGLRGSWILFGHDEL